MNKHVKISDLLVINCVDIIEILDIKKKGKLQSSFFNQQIIWMILMCSSMRNKSEVNSYIASFNVFSIHVFNSLMHMVLNRKNKSTYYPSQPPQKIETSSKF